MKKILLILISFFAVGNYFVYSQGPPMWSLGGNTGTGSSYIGTNNAQDLILKTNGQTRVIIDKTTGGFRVQSLAGSGNGVVFTTGTGELFRINLPYNANYFLNGDGSFSPIPTIASGWSTTASLILADAGKNVGIGVSNPTDKLAVLGTVNIDGLLHVDSIQVGDASLHLNSNIQPIIDPLTGISTLSPYNRIYTSPTLSPSSDFYNALWINCQSLSPNTFFNINHGRVGIGTPIPAAKVTIRDGFNANLCIGAEWLSGTHDGIMINSHNDLSTAHTPLIFAASRFHFHGGAVRIGDVTTPNVGGDPGVIDGYRLYVQYGILTERVKVAVKTTGDWSDYTFADDYKLLSLDSVEIYIDVNNHLQGIPSAEEMVKNGNDLGLTDKLLLEKIENLYLYIIQLNKEIKLLKTENKEVELLNWQNELLKAENELLIKQNELLKAQNELLVQQNNDKK